VSLPTKFRDRSIVHPNSNCLPALDDARRSRTDETDAISSNGDSEGDLEADALLRAIARAPSRRARSAALPGTRWGLVGRYIIQRRLGRGGMGTVYAASDTVLHRVVALKVLDAVGSSRQPAPHRRLIREAQLAARVEHQRIARVYDVGTYEGFDFVAMEYVPGDTLRKSMTEREIPLAQVVDIAMQIAEGLAALHEVGVVHRDLKPENVILTAHGGVKLLDFGLARHSVAFVDDSGASIRATTLDGASVASAGGTPGYMAPEQWTGEPIDARVDVFSLGVIVYELVTRKRLLRGATTAAVMKATFEAALDLHDDRWVQAPERLRELVGRMLARDPARRLPDGTRVLVALRELAEDVSPPRGQHSPPDIEPFSVIRAGLAPQQLKPKLDRGKAGQRRGIHAASSRPRRVTRMAQSLVLLVLIVIVTSAESTRVRIPTALDPVAVPTAAMPRLNLGFEEVLDERPRGWFNSSSYDWGTARDFKHGGTRSLWLRSRGSSRFGAAIASMPADEVRGRRLTLRAWIKTDGAMDAGMFLRVDDSNLRPVAFDNTSNRGVTGTAEWTERSVQIDVPEQGKVVVFGPLLIGNGRAWFDDLQFEVTGYPTGMEAKLLAGPWLNLNLSFEQTTGETPTGWGKHSSYRWSVVRDVIHDGSRSLRLQSDGYGAFDSATASVPAYNVRGKRLRLRGWVKTEGVTGAAAMFLRVDGPTMAFNNMKEGREGISGTTGWTQISLELDVPQDGEYVVFGPVLFGEGVAWFDELQLEVIEHRPILLEGTVVDANGNLVAGADVALVALGGIREHVRSDVHGKFRFTAAVGRWGFSVNCPGYIGSFVDSKQFDSDAKAFVLTLGSGGGVLVRGRLKKGKPATNAYVEVWPVSGRELVETLDSRIFAVAVAADGTFEAVLPQSDEYVARIIDHGTGRGSARRVGDRVELIVQ
jgi:serine/threonine protein kinase